MSILKTWTLGTVAAIAATGAAVAADLPGAEPVEYVQICDTFGNGFFVIPGTDTCLRIAGLVRVDYRWEQDDDIPNPPFSTAPHGGYVGGGGNDFVTDIRARLQADARSETEYGTLRSFIEYEGRADSFGTLISGGTPNDYSNGYIFTGLRQAFIQFAGVTAGLLSKSLYDYAPAKVIAGGIFTDEGVNTLAYTAEIAKGFDVTVGIEDKYFRAVPQTSPALDQVVPSGIAALAIKQAWGDAKIAAAIQDNNGDIEPEKSDELGWAVQGGLTVNLPSEVKGSKVYGVAGYTEGALSYIGIEDWANNFRNDGLGATTIRDQIAGVNTEGWLVGGGVHWQWTKKIGTGLTASYSEIDAGGTGGASSAENYEYLFVEGNIYWSPVKDFEIGVAVQYGDLQGDTFGGVAFEEDQLAGVLRLARTF